MNCQDTVTLRCLTASCMLSVLPREVLSNQYTLWVFTVAMQLAHHIQTTVIIPKGDIVGASHKSTSGPFQGSADNPHVQISGPFQAPDQTATRLSAALFRAPRHSVSLFQPITSPFILTNHGPVYSDQSQTTYQPSEPNKRRPPGLVKPDHHRSLILHWVDWWLESAVVDWKRSVSLDWLLCICCYCEVRGSLP